jgi:hypothetical protein
MGGCVVLYCVALHCIAVALLRPWFWGTKSEAQTDRRGASYRVGCCPPRHWIKSRPPRRKCITGPGVSCGKAKAKSKGWQSPDKTVQGGAERAALERKVWPAGRWRAQGGGRACSRLGLDQVERTRRGGTGLDANGIVMRRKRGRGACGRQKANGMGRVGGELAMICIFSRIKVRYVFKRR